MAGHGHEPAAHSHTGDVGEDYNIGTIVTVGVIGCLLIFLTIIWLRALYARADRWEWDNKVVAVPFAELNLQREAQATKLNGGEWSDPAAGRVTIPLASAQAIVLHKLQSEQLAQLATTIAEPEADSAGAAAAEPEHSGAAAAETGAAVNAGESNHQSGEHAAAPADEPAH